MDDDESSEGRNSPLEDFADSLPVEFKAVDEPFPVGLSDLRKIVQQNEKTQANVEEVEESVRKLMKNANAYVLELKLLEDIENVLKDTTKRNPVYSDLVNDLLENDNWLRLYGLESSEELQETYSKIKSNIRSLFIPNVPVLEDNGNRQENSEEKNYKLRRALRCLKQATSQKRPLSSSAVENQSSFLPSLQESPSRRPKTSSVLPQSPKRGQKSSRNFSSEDEEEFDFSFSEDDRQYRCPVVKDGQNNARHDLINVNNFQNS